MDENQTVPQPYPLEADAVQTPNDGGVPEGTPDPSRSKVEFDLTPGTDDNREYSLGVFFNKASKLRKAYAEMLEEDPEATYRLTLERV